MERTLSVHQLRQICELAAEMGARTALVRAGKLKPYLSKAHAFRIYGRANIEHWIDEGYITPRKDGDHSSHWRIDRLEVEALIKSTAILKCL